MAQKSLRSASAKILRVRGMAAKYIAATRGNIGGDVPKSDSGQKPKQPIFALTKS